MSGRKVCYGLKKKTNVKRSKSKVKKIKQLKFVVTTYNIFTYIIYNSIRYVWG